MDEIHCGFAVFGDFLRSFLVLGPWAHPLAAFSASRASAFAHSLLFALKLLFTSLFFLLYRFSFFVLFFLILSFRPSSFTSFLRQFCSILYQSYSSFVCDQELTPLELAVDFLHVQPCISHKHFRHSGCHRVLLHLVQVLPSS